MRGYIATCAAVAVTMLAAIGAYSLAHPHSAAWRYGAAMAPRTDHTCNELAQSELALGLLDIADWSSFVAGCQAKRQDADR